MDYLAPAGTPIPARVLAGWARDALLRRDGLERLRAGIAGLVGVDEVFFVSSGRAAMAVLLRALHESRGEPARNQVIVPGYTCYSVPASVRRAGLEVRVCDIDPATLSYDVQALEGFDFTRVLAIVSANLYGIPNDLPAIERIAARNGVHLVDDAAQALGARIAGRHAGTFGDAGLYSLDKGKNITSMQGGILVSKRADVAAALRIAVDGLPPPSPTATLAWIVKLLGYTALLPPARYGLTRGLPFLGLGKTPYTEEYPLTRYSPTLGALPARMLPDLPTLQATRVANANAIVETLRPCGGLRAIGLLPGAEPAYVRLPLLLTDPRDRAALLAAFDRAGIGATASYPAAIADIPELRDTLQPADRMTPGARSVAERIVTLPTHPFVTAAHIARMHEAARQALAPAAALPATPPH